MTELNSIAIALTQKIEHDLVYEFHTNKNQPNFKNIREKILDTLYEYIGVFAVEIKESPLELKQMPDTVKTEYMNHKIEVQAADVVKKILTDEDIATVFEYKGDYDIYRSITKYIPIIKLNKLIKNTDKDYFKGRF